MPELGETAIQAPPLLVAERGRCRSHRRSQMDGEVMGRGERGRGRENGQPRFVEIINSGGGRA